MRFEKWQALGNDYLIVERSELPNPLSPARVRRICDPHFGVGSDGILLLSEPAEPQDVADLRIFNPDGSEAELSGNGAREAILYLRHRGWTDADTFSIGTPAGRIRPTITGPDTCSVDMGVASLASEDFPGGPPDGRGQVSVDGHRWDFRHVSIGNPQCSIRIGSPEELEQLRLGVVGPPICDDPRFPNRTNVSWYTELAGTGDDGRPARIRARIFERGVGETLSSGTGASGAAIAYVEDEPPRPGGTIVVVSLDGGELEVEVGEDLQVTLTGWARPVFAGVLSEDLVKELHETE